MVPTEEKILNTSYGAARYDQILGVPNNDTLHFIAGAGLDLFFPKWIDFETGIIDEKRLEQEVWETVAMSYLTPSQFRARPPQPQDLDLRGLNYRGV